MVCPECNGELNGGGNNYTCTNCGTRWNIEFTCNVCKNKPTLLRSCGSASFFCETCKVQKSREAMDKEFTKLKGDRD